MKSAFLMSHFRTGDSLLFSYFRLSRMCTIILQVLLSLNTLTQTLAATVLPSLNTLTQTLAVTVTLP